MTVYFLTFGISFLLCLYGEMKADNKSANVFYGLSVLTVCVLAGARDLNIGTDVANYLPFFSHALESESAVSFIGEYYSTEPLYALLIYLCSRISSDMHCFLFAASLITYTFAMLGILNYKKQISVSLAWLCFLLMFYCDSYNAIRQFIAATIAFWGFKFAQDGKYIKYAVTLFVAVMFHNMAFICVLFFVIYWILQKKNTLAVKLAIIFVAFVGCATCTQSLGLLADLGLIPERYMAYVPTQTHLSNYQLLIRLPFFALIISYYKSFCEGSRGRIEGFSHHAEGDFLIIMLAIELFFLQLMTTSFAFWRFGTFFGMFRAVAYSRVCSVLKKRDNRLYAAACILVVLMLIWAYEIVYAGKNEVYPYTSAILGIL